MEIFFFPFSQENAKRRLKEQESSYACDKKTKNGKKTDQILVLL